MNFKIVCSHCGQELEYEYVQWRSREDEIQVELHKCDD